MPKTKAPKNPPPPVAESTSRFRMTMNELLTGAYLGRDRLLKMLTDPKRDIDNECGYPAEIQPELYRLYYERDGLATRVVNIFPEEGWSKPPEVYEDEDEGTETDFELKWKALCEKHKLLAVLERADTLSGIGRFGVILLGLDDGEELERPVDGFLEKEFTGGAEGSTELLYLRAFDESVVKITSWEADTKNPRFGMPTQYTITYQDPSGGPAVSKTVHWHRIVHLADDRAMSEVFGTPRLRPVFNFLYNLKKVLGGGSEMFWKGGFPGFAFELAPGMDPGTLIDEASMRKEMDNYSNGLQRYLALTGVSAKQLSPQVADPTGHLEANVKAICISKGIPYRIFMGTEEAQLAGAQDNDAWMKRVAARREKYQTPYVIRNVVDHLMRCGVLPVPAEVDEESGQPKYFVFWPDLTVKGAKEKADIALVRVQALAQYIQASVDDLVPPTQFFTMFFGMTKEEAEEIVEAATEFLTGQGEDADLGDAQDELAAEAMQKQQDAMIAAGGGKQEDPNQTPTTKPGAKGAAFPAPAKKGAPNAAKPPPFAKKAADKGKPFGKAAK